jgi:hypothetical protein
LQSEDDEAPEDDDMHPPGWLFAAHELLLSKTVDQKFVDPITDAVKPINRGRRLQQLKSVIQSFCKAPESNQHNKNKDHK